MPETNLKWVLMELGNRLVLKHGFDPPIASIKSFTEFLNRCPEAQIILREMGFEWPIVKPSPIVPFKAGGNNEGNTL